MAGNLGGEYEYGKLYRSEDKGYPREGKGRKNEGSDETPRRFITGRQPIRTVAQGNARQEG